MATVIIPSLLRDLSGGHSRVTVSGSTLRQVINNLDAQFPGMKARLVDSDLLRPEIAIGLNGEEIAAGLSEPIPDDAEISIVPAIAGGAPSDDELREIETLATALAEQGGAVLVDRFRSALNVQFKDDHKHDPVTEVDRAVEQLVRDGITQRFPTHGVLGEEGADTGPADADFIWVVDPLDGTTNFINGLATFACSIGVLWRGVPVVGAIFLPTTSRLESGVYHARFDGGMAFGDERINFRLADVGPGARLSAMPGGTSGVTGPKGRRFGNARTLGSVAAELTLTAEGTMQMCLFSGAKIWDVAGGAALCMEAGASVYVKSHGDRYWRPLERFAGSDDQPPTFAQLRAWNQTFTAGHPSVIPDLTADLQKEQGPLRVLRRLLSRADTG
jgi:myo-inositol-1(or 4)-monophosphatase